MQLQFLSPVEFFLAVERLQFLTRAELLFFDIQFCRCAVSHVYTFIKTDKFNHFGRSDAWNSTHHGRYVFPSVRSAASLSISSLSLCLSPCVVCVGVRGLRRVFVSRCVWSKRNEK